MSFRAESVSFTLGPRFADMLTKLAHAQLLFTEDLTLGSMHIDKSKRELYYCQEDSNSKINVLHVSYGFIASNVNKFIML